MLKIANIQLLIFCTFSLNLFGQISLEYFAGNRGVTYPDFFKNDQYMFVETENIVVRSIDGEVFEPIIQDKSGYLKVEGHNLTYLYFKESKNGFNFGLLTSHDSGNTWEDHDLPHSDISANFYQLINGTILIPSYSNYLLRSTDYGVTWDSLNGNSYIPSNITIDNYYYNIDVDNNIIAVNKSTNDTIKYNYDNQGLSGFKEMVVHNGYLFVRFFREVIVMDKELTKILSRIDDSPRDLVIIDSSIYHVGSLRVYKFDDANLIWNSILPPFNFERIYSYFRYLDKQYVSENNKQIYRIDSDGKVSISGNGINREKIFFVSSGSDFIVTKNTTKISIYREKDQKWENHFEVDDSWSYSQIAADGNSVIAYLDNNNDRFLISQDKGISWEEKTYPYPKDYLPFDMQMLIKNGNIIIYGDGNFISEDYGETWNQIPYFLENEPIYFKGKYYGVTYYGIFETTDLKNISIQSTTPNTYNFHGSNNYLFKAKKISNSVYEYLMTTDAVNWIDVSKNAPRYITNTNYFIHEWNEYVYALSNYDSYRLNINKLELGWELISEDYLGNIFYFNEKLLSAQAGIYSIYINENEELGLNLKDIVWKMDNNNEISLSKKLFQRKGRLYNQVLQTANEISNPTNLFINEESGVVRVLNENFENKIISYNIKLNQEINLDSNKILKLVDKNEIYSLSNSKFNIYSYELSNGNEISHLNYIPQIGDRNYFISKNLTQYFDLGVNKVSCIYHNETLLFSNSNECESPTNTTDAKPSCDFKLFPNPITNNLNIESNQKTFNKYNIHFFNSSGKLSYEFKIETNEIQMQNLTPGLYYYIIKNDLQEIIQNGKLIKM